MPCFLMNMFQSAFDKESKALGFKSLKKSVTRRGEQTGTSNKKRDKARKAMPPGKRISKTGNTYYEGRKNRSDLFGEKI